MANELTDSDRTAIAAINVRRGKIPASAGGIREEHYLAGKAAGIAEGIEMAAKACEKIWDAALEGRTNAVEADVCFRAIRALKSSP